MDTSLKSAKPRDYALDAMRVIAILAVVLIHTSTRILEVTHYDLNTFGFDLFLNQISRFAVPLFFLISGFALELSFNSHGSYLIFFKKRISKILVPYLFWSTIFYLFIYTKHGEDFLHALIDGSSSYQLYFIPALLIFYFLFPLVHKFYKLLSNKWVFITLGIIELLLLRQDYYIKALPINYSIRIALLNFFVFLVGIIASRNINFILKLGNKLKLLLVPLIIYFGFYIFNEGKAMYFKIWNIDAIYSQWRVSILIYTLLLAVFLYYIFTKMSFKIFHTLSNLSFFVFFVHTFILELIWKLVLGYNLLNPWLYILFFLSVSSISFSFAYLIHKVPALQKLTG